MIPSDPVIQVAIAAFCSLAVAIVLFLLSGRMPTGRTRIANGLLGASALAAVIAVGGAFHAVHLASEIDDGDYALLRIAMPVDPRLVPVVQSAMKDGRITYGEYDTMKFKGAIPDRRVMRTIVAQDLAELQP